jgi:hypothetical protein
MSRRILVQTLSRRAQSTEILPRNVVMSWLAMIISALSPIISAAESLVASAA